MSRSRRLQTAIALSGVLASVTAAITLVDGTASANVTPPVASAVLDGTWVNTNASSQSLKQILISPAGTTVSVDAFGACLPTFCEWGAVPATIFGPNVSATTGTTFETRQDFVSGGNVWGEAELVGSISYVRVIRFGRLFSFPRLTVQELTTFSDGSGRHNYAVTETFNQGSAATARLVGFTGGELSVGQAPAASPSLAGAWVNSTSNAIAGVNISTGGSSALVQALGACSPTACNIGTAAATILGTGVSALTGSVLSVSYNQSYGSIELIMTPTSSNSLSLQLLRTFNDGRSNYTVSETLSRG